MNKSIEVRKYNPPKCFCGEPCNYIIIFNDLNKPHIGEQLSKKGEVPVRNRLHPTRTEYSCTAEHAIQTIEIILKQEGEIKLNA